MPASLLAAPNGVLLVDKPQAITSHDVVARRAAP
jgi:tRNA pseudouridine55 synthase